MKKAFRKSLKCLAFAAVVAFSGPAFISCTDEIEMENRFTFKGELISTYLENNSDRFSSFIYILNKAQIGRDSLRNGSMFKTLSTYGAYTCFVPTNEAIDQFLKEQADLYHKGEKTGISSPYLEDLADSSAVEIAKNHLIEDAIKTIDVGNGSYPKSTMNHRETELETKNDENGHVYLLLNDKVRILENDLEKENGYVNVIDKVLAPSKALAFKQVGKHASFSLFYQALEATGLNKIIEEHEIDPGYDPEVIGPHFSHKSQNGKTVYPPTKFQKFTILVESDDLLADSTKNHLGLSIQSLEDLEKFASEWYGTKDLGNYKSTENPLYQFMAYHILDRKLEYLKPSGPGGFIMENYTSKHDFDIDAHIPKTHDRYDYFETLLPHTSIKCTKPFSNDKEYIPYGTTEKSTFSNEIILNYAQDEGERCVNPNMQYHINVVVEKDEITRKRPGLAEFEGDAENARVYTIDRILVYNDDEMKDNILNERMRWDASSLFPELTNNQVRWMLEERDVTKSGTKINGALVYIPNGFCKRLRQNNENTHMFYQRPHQTFKDNYAVYMGDELLASSDGAYDFEYRLPYVPSGTYEIRFGFSLNESRGVCQFYLGGKVCGIPVDMRRNAIKDPTIGWFDESGMSESEIKENDKSLRNRGWMKGPSSCILVTGDDNISMRDSEYAIRKIVGIFNIDRESDVWFRFKDVTEKGYKEFSQDYLEIVPKSIYDGATPEDDK